MNCLVLQEETMDLDQQVSKNMTREEMLNLLIEHHLRNAEVKDSLFARRQYSIYSDEKLKEMVKSL